MANENQNTPPAQEEAGESTNLPLSTPGKSEWPELVGVTASEAEKKIMEEKIGAQVSVVPPNCLVTCDWRVNRVRIYVDSSGKVIRPPRIG